MSLADIIEPDSLTIEDYGDEPPRKVLLAGMYDLEGVWRALYCSVRADVLARVKPYMLGNRVREVELRRLANQVVAIAHDTRCMGLYKIGFVDSIGECVLPEPFDNLDDLVSR